MSLSLAYAQSQNTFFSAEPVDSTSWNWVVPSPEKYEDLPRSPERSSWVISLNGTWDFSWVEQPKTYLSRTKLGSILWDPIEVPGNWQLSGKYDPPLFGDAQNGESSLGIYKKEFQIPPKWKGGSIFLRINGGGQEAKIHLNGREVKTIKHAGLGHTILLPSGLIRNNNTLIIQLPHHPEQLSEDPYSWKLNGLERGVYVIFQKGIQIRNLFTYRAEQGSWRITSHLFALNPKEIKGSTFTYRLTDTQNNVISEEKKKLKAVDFRVPVSFEGRLPYVFHWSSEEPNLYKLEIEIRDSKGKLINYTNKNIGFSGKRFDQNVIKVNGKYQKIKAVRYRFFDPQNGYAISEQKLEKDLRLIKSVHANAIYIRKAAPEVLFRLCEKIGLYVISEVGESESLPLQQTRMRWESSFACLLMHTYKEEAPAYPCKVPCVSISEFKAEGIFFEPDLTLGDAREKLLGISELKPINVLGAWADQSLYAPGRNGEGGLTYQGVTRSLGWKYPKLIDGMVDALRRPQPELDLIRQLFYPVQIKCFEDHLIFQHDFAFKTLSDFSLYWSHDGADGLKEYKSKLPPYFPNFRYKIKYPFERVKAGECLQVWARKKADDTFEADSLVLGEGFFCPKELQFDPGKKPSGDIRVLESITNLDFITPHFSLSFDKGINMLQSIRVENKEILSAPPEFRPHQGASVNDKIRLIQKNQPPRQPGKAFQVFLDEIEVIRPRRDQMAITYIGKLFREESLQYNLRANYTLNASGEIDIDYTLSPLYVEDGMQVEQLWQIELDRGLINWKTSGAVPEGNSISNFQYPFLIPLFPQKKHNADWVEVSPLDQSWNMLFSGLPLPPFYVTNINLEAWYLSEHLRSLRRSQTSSFTLGPLNMDEESGSLTLSYQLRINGGQ